VTYLDDLAKQAEKERTKQQVTPVSPPLIEEES
jgi:hypothetical protein